MADVQIVAGPARSGKTSGLLERYRRILAEPPLGGGLWIAPNRHAASDVRQRLVGELGSDGRAAGFLSPAVYTFQQFVQLILSRADRPQRFVGKLLKRQLIEHIVAEELAADRLKHFGPIANRPGLIDILAGVIADLKRQEMPPDRFAKSTATETRTKSREIAAVYARYQQLLREHGLADAEERVTHARDLLKELPKTEWGSLAGVRLVVVDGFSDFARTQQEILELLAAQTERLIITLPLERQTDRGDLYYKPTQTKNELQTRFGKLTIDWRDRKESPDWPAMAHLERRLFSDPRNVIPCKNTAGIEIVATAGQRAEIELIARRIKQLLVLGDQSADGVPVAACDIVVTFRSLESIAPLVDEVFREYGLPIALDWSPTLNRVPLLQALLGLLKLQSGDWPYRQLLAVIGNNFFQPEWLKSAVNRPAVGHAVSSDRTQSVAATEWAVRQLQIPLGRKKLLAALQRRASADARHLQSTAGDDIPADDGEAAEAEEQRAQYRLAHALFTRLENVLSQLAKPRPIDKWIAAIEELAESTGLLAAADDAGKDAWSQLKTALAAGEQLETKWLNVEPEALSLSKFISRLQDIYTTERLPIDNDDVGRVRVLTATSLRGIQVPYLFVGGASEKSFPLPGRDDYVYSESEFEALNKAGLRFPTRRDRACDEMLLFYEVLTRATKRLVISYPALDATAQPLLESPYVVELERSFGPDVLKQTVEISLSPVSKHEHLCSPAQQRVKAVAEFMEDKPRRLAKLIATPTTSTATLPIVRGLESVAARSNRQDFSPWEGIFIGEAAKHLLAKRFGPEHCWSVSRLEEYAYCPFRYFAANLLDLEPLPDLNLEIDFGRRGQLAHDVLAKLHRRLNEAGERRSPTQVGADEYARLTEETLAVLFEPIARGSPLDVALRTIDFRLIADWMREYLGQHEKYDEATATLDKALRPAHFEISFGMQRRRRKPDDVEVDDLSTEKALEVCHDGERIRLSGRIDRIDIGMSGGQVVFNVVDYKTGVSKKLKSADFERGLGLQLPLYALAVQELLMIDRRAVPWRVGYWYLKDRGFETHSLPQFFEAAGGGLQETDAWRSLRGTLLCRVVALVRGIRNGEFPVFSADEECTSRCEYKTVCRIGQIRSLEKTWPPPAKV